MNPLRLERSLVDSEKKLYVHRDGQFLPISGLRWKPHSQCYVAYLDGETLRVIELREGQSVYVERRDYLPITVHPLTRRPMPEGWKVVREVAHEDN
jgi:hypothetical protein